MAVTKITLVCALFLVALNTNGNPAYGQFQLLGVTYGPPNTSLSQYVQIDPLSGQGVFTGLAGTTQLNSLTIDNSGAFYSVGGAGFLGGPGNQLVILNPQNGTVISSSVLNFGGPTVDVRDLTFSSNGTLYAIEDIPQGNNTLSELYKIDLASTHSIGGGLLVTNGVLVGSTGVHGIQALGFSSSGILYGWDVGGTGLVTINTTTGLATDVNPLVNSAVAIQAMTFAPDGTLYGAFNSLYQDRHYDR